MSTSVPMNFEELNSSAYQSREVSRRYGYLAETWLSLGKSYRGRYSSESSIWSGTSRRCQYRARTWRWDLCRTGWESAHLLNFSLRRRCRERWRSVLLKKIPMKRAKVTVWAIGRKSKERKEGTGISTTSPEVLKICVINSPCVRALMEAS